MKQHKRRKNKIERYAEVARHSAAAQERNEVKMADTPGMESQIGDFLESMTASMDASLDQMLLPDSYVDFSLEGGDGDKVKLNSKEIFDKLRLLEASPAEAIVKNPVQLAEPDLLLLEGGASPSSSKAIVQCVGDGQTVLTAVEANRLLTIGSSQGRERYEVQGSKVMAFMAKHGLPITLDAYNVVLFNLVRYRLYDESDRVFDSLIASDLVPDAGCWETHIYSHCLRGGRANIEKAIAVIENLKKMTVPVTCKMFNAVLQQFVHDGLTDEAKDFWFKMHLQPDLALDAAAFNTAIKMCVRGGEAERALFFYEEMRGCGVQPDLRTFEMLFRAVAKAPHWKRGYSDIIFEVMDYMEGRELVPDTRVYNAVINAFAYAGDPVAAEFYFWEMRRKGIAQDRLSYFNLFLALAKGQRVGDPALRYGKKGRYSPPPEREKSPMELAWAEVGATQVFKTMAKTYAAGQDGGNTLTGYKDRGSRQTDPYVAPDEGKDGGKEYEVEMQRAVMSMAREKRRKEGRGVEDLLYGFELEALESQEQPATIDMSRVLLIEQKLSAGAAAQHEVEQLVEGLGEDELALLYQRIGAAASDPSPAPRQVRGYAEAPPLQRAQESPQYADGNADEFDDPFLKDLDRYLGEASFRDPAKAKKNALSNHQQQLLSLIDNEPFAAEMESKELVAAQRTLQRSADPGSARADAWEQVEFGRAPHPDYARPLSWRQQCNKNKADKLFADLLRHCAGTSGVSSDGVHRANVQRIDVNADMINVYASVHAEAGDVAGARGAADRLKELNIRPDARTYEVLVRAAVLADSSAEAARALEETKAAGLVPTRLAYGYLVHHHAAAGAHLEAFRVLEEAQQRGITLLEKHYKTLRRRCAELGTMHPAIPEDPLQWAWDAKKVSKRLKRAPEKRIHKLKSLTYY